MKRLLSVIFASLFLLVGAADAAQKRPGKLLTSNNSITSSAALDLRFDSGILDSRITLTRASNGTYFNATGILQTATTNEARFDYNPSTLTPLGLLIEGARTNITLQSEVLTTTWTIPGANTTITTNAGVAPDGATTAEDVLHDDNAETIQQAITVTDNMAYAISAFVKQGSTGAHDFVKMSWIDDSAGTNGFEAWFDVSDCTIGTAQAEGTGSYTASTARTQALPNGWCRIEAVGQIVSGQTDARFEISNTTADAVDTAEATNSIFWWGLVAEASGLSTAGAFASSYIVTTTAAVTRATDVATMPSEPWFNESSGTFVLEYTPPAGAINPGWPLMAVNDGATTTEEIYLYSGGVQLFRCSVTVGGATQAIMRSNTGMAAGAGVTNIGALAYAVNDLALTVNNDGIVTDTSAALPSGITTLMLGNSANPINVSFLAIKRVIYWNRRLPNGKLEYLTQ